MVFDIHNINHLLAAVLLFVSVVDMVMAKILFKSMSRNPNAKPGTIRMLQSAIYGSAGVMVGMAGFFYIAKPL